MEKKKKKALRGQKSSKFECLQVTMQQVWGSLEGRHTNLKRIACVRVKFRVENLRVHNIYHANESSALQLQTERYWPWDAVCG